MAIKTIKYTVDISGVAPATEQSAGTQGDHRVTKLEFALSQNLYEDITLLTTHKVMYHFDVYDGAGGIWQSEPKELGSNVQLELEKQHTRFGGKITVYLVITALSQDNETEMELYSFPSVLQLKNRPDGTQQDGEKHESVAGLVEVAKQKAAEAALSAETAESINKEVQDFAAEIEEKLKSGDYKGEKGDTGPQGPQGEKGEPGADGKDAVTDQSYSPTSENAQSGKAVAEAISKCMPIPDYEETYGIEKVAVYDDAYYLDDENYTRYIPPSAIKSRPIDDGKGYSYITGLTGSKADTANRAGYIAARDGSGNLWTGDPIDDQDCVPKKYADRFLLKQNSNGMTYEVYALNPVCDTKLEVEDNNYFKEGLSYGTIPCRQSNGNLLTNEPVEDLDCTNKKYVDDLVGDIETLLGGI